MRFHISMLSALPLFSLAAIACSASGSGSNAAGGASGASGAGGGSASGLDCRARSDRADPRDGCYCETLAPGDSPSTDYQNVTNCNSTYAGAGTTVCCKSSNDCVCAYVGCDSDSIPSTCSCGYDHGSAILSSQTEVATCTPPPGGRCCANDGDAQCGCDTLGTQCGAAYGDHNVPSCTATTVTPGCGADAVQVDSCMTN